MKTVENIQTHQRVFKQTLTKPFLRRESPKRPHARLIRKTDFDKYIMSFDSMKTTHGNFIERFGSAFTLVDNGPRFSRHLYEIAERFEQCW